MKTTILIFVLLLTLPISSVASVDSGDQSSYSDLIPAPNSENPAPLGFQQFSKCHGEAKGLGDRETAKACLAACNEQPEAKGCWWLDGSGGFPRECRICLDGPPSRDIFPNDWGIPVNR